MVNFANFTTFRASSHFQKYRKRSQQETSSTKRFGRIRGLEKNMQKRLSDFIANNSVNSNLAQMKLKYIELFIIFNLKVHFS